MDRARTRGRATDYFCQASWSRVNFNTLYCSGNYLHMLHILHMMHILRIPHLQRILHMLHMPHMHHILHSPRRMRVLHIMFPLEPQADPEEM